MAITLRLPPEAKPQLQTPQDLGKKEPVFIEANQMAYDDQKKVVTADGKVEILKGENVLFADHVIYDQNADLVTANGNVVITGPTGETMFTNHFVMKGDFSAAVIKYFRARLSDGSLLAAARAERIDENTMIMHKGVYSPCPVCADSPNPQWQLKGNTVTVDNARQEIVYKDATAELYGIPILYTPYFSHPTPNADSQQGFLTPDFRRDSNVGESLIIPYYIPLSSNLDVTLKPVITTEEGPVGAVELRDLSEYGKMQLFGTITRPTNPTYIGDTNAPKIRGHVEGIGEYDVTDHWDAGFNFKYASDDTYLRRYDYGGEDLLTQQAYAERIDGNDYSEIQALHFQGLLEEDIQKETPQALPYIRNHFESTPGIIPGLGGSTIYADATGSEVMRVLGTDDQRASVTAGVKTPFAFDNGQFVDFEASMRGDQYYIQNSGGDYGPNQNRVIPDTSITWHLPLVDEVSKTARVILEPIAKLLVMPNKDYNKNIPNEDSQDLEFSDLNVFDNNRFDGTDAVESGSRAYYGLRGGYYESNYNVNGLLAQDYSFQKPNDQIPLSSGVEDKFSDVVGRISASLYDKLDLSYKFRLDSNDFGFRRSEVDATLTESPVKLTVTYYALAYDYADSNDPTTLTTNRSEIDTLGQVDVLDQWSVLFGFDRNLHDDQNIDAAGGILYRGDCSDVLVSVRKDFLNDRDAKGGTTVNVKLGLKNIGDL